MLRAACCAQVLRMGSAEVALRLVLLKTALPGCDIPLMVEQCPQCVAAKGQNFPCISRV